MTPRKKSTQKAKTGPKPMADEPIVIMNIRLPASIKMALDKYAHDDMRPASSQLRLILQERLKEKGYLK
jgi:hypothetical protein